MNEDKVLDNAKKKNYFTLFLGITVIILAIVLVFIIRDQQISSKTSNTSSTKTATVSDEVLPTMQIPVEDEVINPPAPPSQ